MDDYPLESLRYVDIHAVLPEESPSELRANFDALLGPLLLNSSLAAIKAEKSTANALIAIGNTTRALNNLELSSADKGAFVFCQVVLFYEIYDDFLFQLRLFIVVP